MLSHKWSIYWERTCGLYYKHNKKHNNVVPRVLEQSCDISDRTFVTFGEPLFDLVEKVPLEHENKVKFRFLCIQYCLP
jgi:hypothetical protein